MSRNSLKTEKFKTLPNSNPKNFDENQNNQLLLFRWPKKLVHYSINLSRNYNLPYGRSFVLNFCRQFFGSQKFLAAEFFRDGFLGMSNYFNMAKLHWINCYLVKRHQSSKMQWENWKSWSVSARKKPYWPKFFNHFVRQNFCLGHAPKTM